MENFQISAKNLGRYAMPDFCPRCEWIKLKTKKLPWQIFPGIFSSIDSYTKKVVHQWIDRKGSKPSFLEDLGVTGYLPTPHWSKFRTLIKEFGITLSGMADDIWQTPDGLHVPDYKTAKYTKNQDKLFPMYQAQVNGYARIGIAKGMNVTGLSLVYMVPQTEESDAFDGSHPWNHIFKMNFAPHFIPITMDTDSLDPLLEKARQIYDGPIPSREWACQDCVTLEEVICKIEDPFIK